MSGGRVARVHGAVIEAVGLEAVAIRELVEVGEHRLPGEVISLGDGAAVVQVYEYTGGVRPGEPVRPAGRPLSAELGPGLLGGVFDGMLRRLGGDEAFLAPGARPATVSGGRSFAFVPTAAPGAEAEPGLVLGTIAETEAIEHRVLVPEGVAGTIEWIAGAGELDGGNGTVAVVGGADVKLWHHWPVRRPRPIRERLPGGAPLATGQRVLDLLYPVMEGGTAGVPGGFGTGKTMLLQQIAKWSDADVIVYVGCGERGNEMADVLRELPELEDPRTGTSLLGRTVLIANTSNMPVLAREASIHTGVTVAEFFRDMGYRTVLIADSTSRWAEALREVSSRTGELPAEEGYPAGLASELAAFYERAGRVRTLSGALGSVTILGAVSPPGGDMTEPVSAHTARFVRATWSLDRDLAYARHYPAVSWHDSWSRDAEAVADARLLAGDAEWGARRERALALLAEASRLESVAQLVGADALPDRERLVILAGRVLRDGVLQQSALSPNDAYCAPAKQAALLELALQLHDRFELLREHGIGAERIEEVDLSPLLRARETAGPDDAGAIRAVAGDVFDRLEELHP